MVFTDLCNTNVGTVAGIYIEKAGIRKSFRLSDKYGAFQAEILAVLRAAQAISGSTLKETKLPYMSTDRKH